MFYILVGTNRKNSRSSQLAKLAKKKPELAKKFGYNPNRMVAKKGGRARKR